MIPGITGTKDRSELESDKVWKIIKSCKTLDETKSAQKCVDLYASRNEDSDNIVKRMREEILQVSFGIFTDLRKDKKIL